MQIIAINTSERNSNQQTPQVNTRHRTKYKSAEYVDHTQHKSTQHTNIRYK